MHKGMNNTILQKSIAHEFLHWLKIFVLCLIGYDVLFYKFP